MFGPADWSDSMSLQRMVRSLTLDFIIPLMVGFKGNFMWGLPCRQPRSSLTSRGLDNAIVALAEFVLLYTAAWVVMGYKNP